MGEQLVPSSMQGTYIRHPQDLELSTDEEPYFMLPEQTLVR